MNVIILNTDFNKFFSPRPLSSDVHFMYVQYLKVKCLSYNPPLLHGTIFLNRSALLILSLLSDPELKLTPSCLYTSWISPLLVVFLSPLSAVLMDEWLPCQC